MPVEKQSPPDWQQSGYRHVWMPYTQMQTAALPIPVVATEGVYLTLADGRKLIDGMASWWTACHGYNHPHIRRAVEAQLRLMPHVMFGGINHEPALRLAERLAKLTPGDLNRVFFSDSGSVSVEVALKIAVQYWLNRGVSGRTKFVSFQHAYHGDTTGAMSVCDPDNSMHHHFKGFLLEQYSHPVPQTDDEHSAFEAFLATKSSEIAGVIIEPLIQGAGGMKFHPPESVARIHSACRRQNVLLIADEIATGFGRTGTMFACEQADVVPDILCVGKALTGGTLSLAATIATDEIFDAFLSDDPSHALMHGPTFMANPLACAAANASIDLFETEPRLERALAIERELAELLAPCRNLHGVVDVRSKGAVGVIQVNRLHHVERLRSRLVEEGVWLRPFSDMIYMTPALSITPEELQTLCEATVRVVQEWSTWMNSP
ncbi:MAG: adenosylmethionine--8-amino-7-oxononanoate transaminase [Planctomycetota bacterium]|nr:adenosylmethionine--8-amino-7-oxononanoate transaminase [Planctomycetota bacterium]MDA1159357.1 adenosylmethionine--8-amino-7-oxononanoate transaminase [Planctomycetota bacterium]